MATYEINYKSDFTLVMGFTLAGVAVPLPVGNFRIVFRTQEYGTEYECSRINGEYVNCKDNGNDTLLCIFDRHGLRPGALRGEVFDYIPDNTFPDGSQLVVSPSLFDIELVEGAGNTSEDVTAEVVISVEEVVEQARDAALAAENAAEAATDAAGRATEAADRANDAADAATEAVAGIEARFAEYYTKTESDARYPTYQVLTETVEPKAVRLSILANQTATMNALEIAAAINTWDGEVDCKAWDNNYSAWLEFVRLDTRNNQHYAIFAGCVAINNSASSPEIRITRYVVAYVYDDGSVAYKFDKALIDSSELARALADKADIADLAAVAAAVATKADKRSYVDNSADASVELSVSTYNDLGTLSTWKPVTLPASYNRADEFVFRFECGDADLSPALPSGVVLADGFDFSEMAVGVVFQVSIMDGIAAYLVLSPNN